MGDRYVRALIVVVPVIVTSPDDALSLLGSCTREVNSGITEYFMVLKRREFMHALFHGRLRCDEVVLGRRRFAVSGLV